MNKVLVLLLEQWSDKNLNGRDWEQENQVGSKQKPNLWEFYHFFCVILVVDAEIQGHTWESVHQTMMILPDPETFSFISLPVWNNNYRPLRLIEWNCLTQMLVQEKFKICLVINFSFLKQNNLLINQLINCQIFRLFIVLFTKNSDNMTAHFAVMINERPPNFASNFCPILSLDIFRLHLDVGYWNDIGRGCLWRRKSLLVHTIHHIQPQEQCNNIPSE